MLQMQNLEMGEWLQLKNSGRHVGKSGVPLSDLWERSLGYRIPRTSREFGVLTASQLAYAQSSMVEANKLQLIQSVGGSRPLTRWLLWSMKEISPMHKATKL